MNRSMMAAIAFVAGIALAAPLAAYGQDQAQGQSQGQTQPAPAETSAGAAPQQNTPATGGPGVMDRQGMGMPGMGPGWHHGWMGRGRGGWMREGMMRRSPAERCQNRLARRAAMVAYTVTRLDLNAQQRPLWDKLNGILQTGTQKEQQLCNSLKAGAQHGAQTILDRIDRREQFLAAQLDMIRQARPLLQQFYQGLTAEQQAIINHPFRRG